MDKKVLIISYYWPPSGGSGVQRWLKFVKYLPAMGWQTYVFTPENPSFAVQDPSLLKDVPPQAEIIRFPIWEPYDAFFKLTGGKGDIKAVTPTSMVSGSNKTIFQKVTTWLRGNLLIPDPRVFWVKPASTFLHDFLRQQGITTIITTGPPHSMHLIGYRLKKKNPTLKWIADFRDPWSEWGFLDSLMVGRLARWMHRRLEKKVLHLADHIVTITPFYVRQFEQLSGRKVELLTNGYDEQDFHNLNIYPTDKLVIRHIGTVNEKCDPRPFMRAVERLVSENDDFRRHVHIDFTGEVHPQFMEFVRSSAGLQSLTTFTPPVPHKELIKQYGQSSLLLLILTGYKDAEGYMPGKLFEYMATGLPVLATGPENGDAAALLKECNGGIMIDGSNETAIIETLRMYYERWRAGTLRSGTTPGKDYSRRAITEKLTRLL